MADLLLATVNFESCLCFTKQERPMDYFLALASSTIFTNCVMCVLHVHLVQFPFVHIYPLVRKTERSEPYLALTYILGFIISNNQTGFVVICSALS